MAIQTIVERATGDMTSLQVPVFVYDDEGATVDIGDAVAAAEDAAPSAVLGVGQDGNPGTEQLTLHSWRITIRYASGDISVIVSQRREHYSAQAEPLRDVLWAEPVARFPGTAFDFQGAIFPGGYDSTKPGLDIQPGNANVGVQDRVQISELGATWRAAALALVRAGAVNNSTIAGYPAGTLQIVSFRAQQDTATTAQVHAEWSYKPNVSGLTVGGVTGISHQGHDIWWPWGRRLADRTEGLMTTRIESVHVVRPWPRADLSVLGILPPSLT